MPGLCLIVSCIRTSIHNHDLGVALDCRTAVKPQSMRAPPSRDTESRVPVDQQELTSRYPNCETQVHALCLLSWLAFLCRPPPSASLTSSQLIPCGGKAGIYTRLAHHREGRGEKESTARVLLVYSQLDKSKRETIKKHVTRHKSQFYASNTRYDPIREWVSYRRDRREQDGLLGFVKRPTIQTTSSDERRPVCSPAASPRAHQARRAPATVRAASSPSSELQA